MPPLADTSMAQRAATVHRLAAAEGFVLLGIAPAEPSAYAAQVRQWIAEGRHGQMAYLADPARLEQMLDPRQFVPGAKSIICVADRYVLDDAPLLTSRDREGAELPAPLGRIARYAWGDDYHQIIKKRLHHLADALHAAWPDQVFRSAVDTAPVLEREHAGRAGLGWVGKHTLLIHPQLGSHLALGEIVTTQSLQSSAESGMTPALAADHCGTCTRCIDACPTSCIAPQGYSIDASRCISYLTIEHRGPIDPALHPLMGQWIAGCDVCQEVCPFNQRVARREGQATLAAGEVGGCLHQKLAPPVHNAPMNPPLSSAARGASSPGSYRLRPPAPALPLAGILNWQPDDRRHAFQRSALKRIALADFKRNALIAAGNYLATHRDPDLWQRIVALSTDPAEDESVRLTARQTLDRLAANAAQPSF